MRLSETVVGALVLAVLLSFTANADDGIMVTSVAISKDRNIIFAAHPYFPKKERKIFDLRGRIRNSVPIGVMIQNYGNFEIFIERLEINYTKSHAEFHIPLLTPYVKRPLGAIAEREYFDDGKKLNIFLHDAYKAGNETPLLSTNEIFYKPELLSKKAFYGLVFLEKRNPRPQRVTGLYGLVLEIYFRDALSLKPYVAKLSLDGLDENTIEPVSEISEVSGFKCENEACKKISGRMLYEANLALHDCYSKSLGENGKIKDMIWGKSATAWVKFNRNGDYISHEPLEKSGIKGIDEALDAVAEGMKNCELPSFKITSRALETDPYFNFRIGVGDTFKKQAIVGKSVALESDNTDIPENFKYGKYTYLNIKRYPDVEYFIDLKKRFEAEWEPVSTLRNDLQGNMCQGRAFSTVIGVGAKDTGDVTEVFVLKSSGLPSYDSEAIRTIRALGILPAPTENLLEKGGILRMAWTFVVYL